jgi:tetratricopeptide (TPR) repeat protein
MQQSRHEEAERAGQAAIQLLEPLGDSEEMADALHRLAWFLWRRGREREAEPLLRRAIDISARVDATLVRAEATQTLAVCLLALGSSAEANLIMEEAFRLAKEAGDSQNLMRAYNNVANTRAALQGPAAAADVVREGLELALRFGVINNAGWIAGTLGDTEIVIGRLEEAEEHERLAVSLAQRVGDEPLTGQRLVGLAMALVMRGRIDEAVAIRNQAAPVMAANPEPQALMYLPAFDGFVALGRQDRAAAADAFAESAKHARAYNIHSFPEIIPECARAFVLLGALDRAKTYRDLDASPDSIQSAAHGRNVAGLLEADANRAVAILREAVAELERLEMRVYAARAMVDLGRAMARAGEDPREMLERARALLTECDARLFLFEVDEVLAEVR